MPAALVAALRPPYDRSITMVTEKALSAISFIASADRSWFLPELLASEGACEGEKAKIPASIVTSRIQVNKC